MYFPLRAILRMFKFIPDEFVPTFCGCREKVWSGGKDAVRKTQWIAVCEAHALVRAAHNLSGRRPCSVHDAVHAVIFKRKKRPVGLFFNLS
jgi:hypothetical protein